MHQLYRNIKNLREEKDISQTKLAELTGYTNRSSITKIEKGEVDLSLSKIEQFAKVLGKEPEELVGWEDEEPSKESSPRIMQYYELLNDTGKHEALKRVKELTEIPRYVDSQISSEDALRPIAAHNDYIDEPGELEKMRRDIASLRRPD